MTLWIILGLWLGLNLAIALFAVHVERRQRRGEVRVLDAGQIARSLREAKNG